MLSYEYKEYEKYLRNKYSIPAFIEMWNDADIGYTIGKENNLWYVIEDGVKDYFNTDNEFFKNIDVFDLKPYEEKYGYMY